MTMAAYGDAEPARRSKYTPPRAVSRATLQRALEIRGAGENIYTHVADMFGVTRDSDLSFDYAGDLSLLAKPVVAIVGTREVSANGAARARRLSKELSAAGVLILSGLALGVDTEAHHAAIRAGGSTAAVIGTPIDRCSPMQNAALQEEIAAEHLLISQFAVGSTVRPANFPLRNRLMAALCDATVIIEASDTSGTLHQAAECMQRKRKLGIVRAVAEDTRLSWPAKFLKYDDTFVVETAQDVLRRIGLG